MSQVRTFLASLAVALLGLLANTHAAAILDVNGSGILTGAQNVDVNGTPYNVQFLDGTCAAIFSGCDSVSDFTFSTLTDARAAAQALLDQVFLDVGAGAFDSHPELTFGCTDTTYCYVWIPYGLHSDFGSLYVDGGVAENYALNTSDFATYGFFLSSYDFTNVANFALGYFVPAAAVPEPEPLWLFGAGLVVVEIMRRSRAARGRLFRGGANVALGS